MLTSPSKKKYIGQTIRKFSDRWSQHQSIAKNNSNDLCMAIHNAINKYGAENFKIEILLEVNNELLDFYEVKFINLYDALYPNGYNLTNGGRINHVYSPESRLKMSKTQKALYQSSEKMREHIKMNGQCNKEDKSLPMYLSHEKNKKKILVGYKVHGHPNNKQCRKFCCAKDLPSALARAMEYLEYLNTLNEPEKNESRPVGRKKTNTDLPKYIIECKNKSKVIGYIVQTHKHQRRNFAIETNDLNTNLNLAIEHLNSLKL